MVNQHGLTYYHRSIPCIIGFCVRMGESLRFRLALIKVTLYQFVLYLFIGTNADFSVRMARDIYIYGFEPEESGYSLVFKQKNLARS